MISGTRLSLGLCLTATTVFAQTDSSRQNDTSPQLSPDAIQQLSSERPWQTNDGTIHFEGRRFTSWRSYFSDREANGNNDHRCGVHAPAQQDLDGSLAMAPPSDCSCSSTNPTAQYDPSVGLLRVPCVVHVIRNSSGTLGDIPVDRVISGIRILNEDFKALAGTNGANGNNAQIEFYLAEVDPDGNSTNGITFSNNDSWYNDGGNYFNSLNWDPSRYMNIYTTTAGGNLGYVPFLPACGSPGSASDRVVVLWESYGENAPIGSPYNLGRTLTHEVGHYLGLNHTFNGGCESGSCTTGGDLICDTAPQGSPTFGCNGSACSTPVPDDNYMDYSDDICMEQFTPDQNRRMRCTLEYYRTDLTEPIEQLIELSLNGSIPELVSPAGPTLGIRITEVEAGGYVDGTARLYYTTGSLNQSVSLAPQGNDIYSATLSELPCGAQLAWYFTADDSSGTTRRLPSAGTFTASVADGLEEIALVDFNISAGWTAATTATAGGWERAIPSTDSTSVDTCSAPGTDADGSGYCWVTGNGVSASACANDIDGGSTVLTSSVYAVESPDTELSMAWWYDNTSANNTEYDDVFIIEISGNSGSSWTQLASISNGDSAQTGWTTSSWRVGDYVTVSSGLRIRCTASDNDPGSVVEAGIDAFKLVALSCDGAPIDCIADTDGDGTVGGIDLASVLGTWGQIGEDIIGDLNGDLNVNGLDIAIVLGNWGSCPN